MSLLVCVCVRVRAYVCNRATGYLAMALLNACICGRKRITSLADFLSKCIAPSVSTYKIQTRVTRRHQCTRSHIDAYCFQDVHVSPVVRKSKIGVHQEPVF